MSYDYFYRSQNFVMLIMALFVFLSSASHLLGFAKANSIVEKLKIKLTWMRNPVILLHHHHHHQQQQQQRPLNLQQQQQQLQQCSSVHIDPLSSSSSSSSSASASSTSSSSSSSSFSIEVQPDNNIGVSFWSPQQFSEFCLLLEKAGLQLKIFGLPITYAELTRLSYFSFAIVLFLLSNVSRVS
jgi:hypothetical protein